MAVRTLVLRTSLPHISATVISHLKHSSESREVAMNLHYSKLSRRIGAIATMTSVLLAGDAVFNKKIANGFDFGIVAPDQTIEQAESGVRDHAQALLEVKTLLESESWKVAQKELRRSSSILKQDFYTIINSKPGSQRPQLRKLYRDLFTNVGNLDYAARDNDAATVWECYKNIVIALDDILSRI
uniref:PQL-like protein n=1 Tax=California macrophylla TaxID=337344 RepID=A0A0F7CYI1_9ROSI